MTYLIAMHFLKKIQKAASEHKLPHEFVATLSDFYETYVSALKANGGSVEACMPVLSTFLDSALEQIQRPYPFLPYHKAIREPVDYYQLGLDFLRPIVRFEASQVIGLDNVDTMALQLAAGENVILFANHQTEPDPQAISLLLEKTHPNIAEQMIFIAGHRVTTDPLAVPLSKGNNLLCVYSKRYLEHPPEKKREKVFHNQRTMKKMRELLAEGGKIIYVAPSGGRDRPNAQGKIELAPFDPQSIEMFWFAAKSAKIPTHFYPLALSTFLLLPPPSHIRTELGEKRTARCAPIHLAFGSEIDMAPVKHPENHEQKKEWQAQRARVIQGKVQELYDKISVSNAA